MNDERDLLVWATDGSPGRELLTRYWQPVALVDELPGDSPVKTLRLFGSGFVLSRDRRGGYQLVPREVAAGEGGDGSPRRDYPCQDRNGIVFAYLGEGDIPSLPDCDCYMAPDEHALARAGSMSRPWREAVEAELFRPPSFSSDAHVLTVVEKTASGLRVVTRCDLEDEQQGIRVANLMFPNAVVVPVSADLAMTVWFVPVDDRCHRWFALWYAFENRIDGARLARDSHDFVPSSATAEAAGEVIKAFRMLLVDGMIDSLGGRAPLFTVDGVSRFRFRGPVAVETVGTAADWQLSWEEADLSRRKRSSWACFIERHWRWIKPVPQPGAPPPA